MSKLRVVHYLNQFFAGVGGEDKAGGPPGAKAEAVGPGKALARALGDQAEVVATVYCGDNTINEPGEAAVAAVVELVARFRPDLVVAGPAFNAGRYGLACGRVGAAVQARLGVPAVTGMYPDNPAVEEYRALLYVVPTGISAATMEDALRRMATLGVRLARRRPIGSPKEEGYIPRGLRFNQIADQPGGVRAVEMLLKRLRGEAFETEWPLPRYDRVPPPVPIKNLATATVALVTTTGIVPRANPGRLESAYATKWLKYPIGGLGDLAGQDWQSVHGGYNGTFVDQDPDRAVPLDVLRDLEADGSIGRLFEQYYVTVGNGASTSSARKFGKAIAAELAAAGVDGVILTAA